MKARSVVFTHVQYPLTVFGLPPSLVVVSFSLSITVMVMTLIFGLVPISMIAFAVTSAMGLAVSYRLSSKDRHYQSLTVTSFLFWLLSPCRWLLSGASPSRSEGGGS